jgi:type IV secretion system protein VirB5
LRKSTSTSAAAVAVDDNPYLNAQRVWLERYGNFVQQAYNWRLIAVLEAIALMIGIVGLIYVAGQSKFLPYIITIDKIGQPVSVHVLDRASPIDERVVHAELANWLADARNVVTDRVVEKSNIDAVYAMVADGSAARGYLDSWYPAGGHSPFERAAKGTVEIAVDAILPVSSETYVVQWTETLRDLGGHVTETQRWEASISVAITPPTDEATIMRNPIGLFITSLNWTQKS